MFDVTMAGGGVQVSPLPPDLITRKTVRSYMRGERSSEELWSLSSNIGM